MTIWNEAENDADSNGLTDRNRSKCDRNSSILKNERTKKKIERYSKSIPRASKSLHWLESDEVCSWSSNHR